MSDVGTDLGRMLTTREAAQLLGLTESTLHTYRSRGVGPQFLRVGAGQKQGRIRYRASALQAFIREGQLKKPEGTGSHAET